jgi:hypothetical protein
MNIRPLIAALTAAVLASCCCSKPPPPPKVYYVNNYIPAGSRIEYLAEIDGGVWRHTMTQVSIPHPMHVNVAKKWAMSAAQDKLGNKWKDYCFRVIPPGGEPVVYWQRRSTLNL